MHKIDFYFRKPEHGWMEIKISDNEKEVILDVSDVPCNSIEILISTLFKLLNGSEMEEVEWSLEPNYALWCFLSKRNEIEVHVFPDKAAEESVAFFGEKIKIIRRIYKKLCDLEVIFDNELSNTDSRQWSWDFPRNDLKKLKQKLDEVK